MQDIIPLVVTKGTYGELILLYVLRDRRIVIWFVIVEYLNLSTFLVFWNNGQGILFVVLWMYRPISIALYMSPSEYIHYRDKYPLFYRLKRLYLHSYISAANSLPVNHLRNIAIANATTSHVWVMDMDMVPSDKLYERLYDLPLSYLQRTDLAIVVPVFSVHYMECNSVRECEKKS